MKFLKTIMLVMLSTMLFACADDTTSNAYDSGIVNGNPPEMKLMKGGVDVGFAGTVTINKTTIDDAAEQYIIKLQSTAQGRMQNFRLAFASTDATLGPILSNIGTLELVNIDAAQLILIASLVPDANKYKGATNVDLSINKIVKGLIQGNYITSNGDLEISAEIIDANGNVSESVAISVVQTKN